MNAAAGSMLAAVVAALLLEGLLRPPRMYQFPFLAAAMMFAFVLPQMPGVARDPFLPAGGFAKVCIMGTLALLLLRFGWSDTRRPLQFLGQTYSETRLLMAAAIFSATGAIFYFKISHLPGEAVIGVQMSGAPVMYLFFARLLIYGLAIAVLCFVRRPGWTAGAIIAFDMVLCFDRILVTGKRAEALELVMIFALALWFYRGWAAPRVLALAAIAAATLAMSSTSDYREITRESASFDWQSIRQIDAISNFQQLLRTGGPELRNAVHRIDYIDRHQEFDFGRIHWNRLVFNYVPAQIVGPRLKEGLMLTMPMQGREYQPATGTTETGMVDAFQSFWYFGALKFLILSYAMSRLWASASSGSTTAQIVYILSIVPAMHAVSHLTDWVVSVWVHMILFLVPMLIFAVARTGGESQRGGFQNNTSTIHALRGA